MRYSYTLLAPLYDLIVARASRRWRQDSLAALAQLPGGINGKRILVAGIGSGLDIPDLPQGGHYAGIDITPAMLRRAQQRAVHCDRVIALEMGDVMALPYADASFDAVVMHLIVAVVPDPARALSEAARVLKPGGRIFILDKFLRPGQRAPLRRLLSPLLGRIATRTDVVFEHVLAAVSSLHVVSDIALNGGWFRRIVLEKISGPDVAPRHYPRHY
ncbi:MAG: methyltransferase domain-containing protein [Gammaproteobacteria bacterium]|nr:methyltransferase domain-containing protein [Gammaproteobacteria bacterium]